MCPSYNYFSMLDNDMHIVLGEYINYSKSITAWMEIITINLILKKHLHTVKGTYLNYMLMNCDKRVQSGNCHPVKYRMCLLYQNVS